MTYLFRQASMLGVGATCLLLISHALEWNGFTLIAAQSVAAIKTVILQTHDWTLEQEKAVIDLYDRQTSALWLASSSIILFTAMSVSMLLSCLAFVPLRITTGLALLALVVTFSTNLPLFFVEQIISHSSGNQALQLARLHKGGLDASIYIDLTTPISSSWTQDYSPMPKVWSPQHTLFLIIFWLTTSGLLSLTFLPDRFFRQQA